MLSIIYDGCMVLSRSLINTIIALARSSHQLAARVLVTLSRGVSVKNTKNNYQKSILKNWGVPLILFKGSLGHPTIEKFSIQNPRVKMTFLRSAVPEPPTCTLQRCLRSTRPY